MKKKLLQSLVLSSILSGAGISAWADGGPFPAPELVKNPSDAVFAPPGFDDNDNVQVVLQSQLINTCYKVAQPEVKVDRARHLITVASQAYVYSSSWCLQVLIPVTQTVDLGILPAGHYRVVEYGTAGRLVHDVSLPVEVSVSAAPDDFIYAPVKTAQIHQGAAGAPNTLVLSGTFSSDCLEMQEVKLLHRTSNIVEVLPVAAFKAGSTCPPKPKSFEVSVALPAIEPGYTLIYVRSLNGQSVSEVVAF